MKSLLPLFGILMAGCGGFSDAVANPIRLTLALEPSEALPCVPVTFRVTAINTSNKSARLPSTVRLEVTPESGAMYVPGSEHSVASGEPFAFEQVTEDFPDYLELKPREERALDYFLPPWLGQSGLLQPGTYRLRLYTDERLRRKGLSAEVDAIRSNEVVLTIAAPSGADGEVWKLIQDERHPCVSLQQHSAELWSRWPEATYTALTVRPFAKGDDAAHLESLIAALAKNPPPAFVDVYKLDIARIHLILMRRALNASDVQQAFEHSQAAKTLLEELSQKDADIVIRQEAKRNLQNEVRTLADLQAADARFRGVASEESSERVGVASLREEIASYLANPATPAERDKLKNVLESLDSYAAEMAAQPPDTISALEALALAVRVLESMSERGALPDGNEWAFTIAVVSEETASRAIASASKDPAVPRDRLRSARESLEKGQASQTDKSYSAAVAEYTTSVRKSLDASSSRVTPR